jgi:cytoskeleton protein RodZ
MTPPEAEITELPSSPGARLKREREAQGLSEQQAAESLNLDPTVIAVLEANDFGALGAPVFVKGHLRRYAMLLGLANDEIVGAYERSKQQVDEPTLVPRARLEMVPVRGRPRWPWVVGGTVAFLAAAAVLSYVSEHGLPWSRGSTADDEPAAGGDVGSLPGPAPQAGRFAVATGETPPTAIGATGAGATTAPQAEGGASGPATAAGTATAVPPVAAPAPGQVRLQLRFTADSWVEIFDGSGKAVLYDLGKAGSERTITATAPLSVTLGNAPAVTIAVNGGPSAAPPSQGAIARFSIAADGTLR